eukprot:1161071-Pelagomonas_calceolata.AAC.7
MPDEANTSPNLAEFASPSSSVLASVPLGPYVEHLIALPTLCSDAQTHTHTNRMEIDCHHQALSICAEATNKGYFGPHSVRCMQ